MLLTFFAYLSSVSSSLFVIYLLFIFCPQSLLLPSYRLPVSSSIHIILCDDPCKISICPQLYGHHCASSIFIIPCADLLSFVCAHRGGYPCPRNKRAKSRVETGSKFGRKTAATMCSAGLRLSLKDPKNLLAVFSHYHKSQVQILSCSSIILLVWMDCLERFGNTSHTHYWCATLILVKEFLNAYGHLPWWRRPSAWLAESMNPRVGHMFDIFQSDPEPRRSRIASSP